MSDCRCTDMKRCEEEVDKLEKNLQSVCGCDERYSRMKNKLSQLISYNSNAFIDAEISNLNDDTQEIDADHIETASIIKEKIANRIKELQEEWKKLHAEDMDFHTTEDEKKEGQPTS